MKLHVAILAIVHAIKAEGIRPTPSAAADAADGSGTLLPNHPTTSEEHANDEAARPGPQVYADWVGSTETPGSSSSPTIGK